MKLIEILIAIAGATVAAWMVTAGVWRGVIHGEDGYKVSRIASGPRFWMEIVVGVVILGVFVVLAYTKVLEL